MSVERDRAVSVFISHFFYRCKTITKLKKVGGVRWKKINKSDINVPV